MTSFLALLPSGQLPAPCFPVPEAGQRPDRTAVAAPHAYGVDDTLLTLSLQQWVNAEGGGIETSLPSSMFRYTFLGAGAEHHP